MDGREVPERNRKRFLAAVAVFLLWVAALGALAVTTGRRPVVRPPATLGR